MGPEWVSTFRGHVIAFTGKVRVDDDWVFREDCARMVMVRGARGVKSDMSAKVSLLVHGDLASATVTDKTRQYSKKLKLADQLRENGHSVVVIDAAGFSDLCAGHQARNRTLLRAGELDVLVLPQVGEGILGGPLREVSSVILTDVLQNRDLGGLDRGSAAHERTRMAFARSLTRRGMQAEEPGRRAPRFDLGWVDGKTVYVAEVKSLGPSKEDHQIRLGLGQVLDYANRMRRLSGINFNVQGIVVSEREPAESDHWKQACQAAGVHLTWGPNFG